MADDIITRWLNEGWVLRANGTALRPRPDPDFPQLPLVISRGQAHSYVLVSPASGKTWFLKKFYPARRPDAYYLSAIQGLVPAIRGTESATSRCVLSRTSLQALSNASAPATRELAAWLDSTVLMAEVSGEGWGNIADDLRVGRTAIPGSERLQIAQSLCVIIESLEKANCAHRDLSSGNVFIELPSQRASLIDWDSFYHKSLPMPLNTTAGTLGYIAPFIPRTGSDWDAAASWKEGADRFSLSLLAAEIMMTTVGTPLTNEGGIFDQLELCNRSGPRLDAVVSRVRSDLPLVYQLLMRTLQGASFADCPSPAEWRQTLDTEARQNSAFLRLPRGPQTGIPPSKVTPPIGTQRTYSAVMPVSWPGVAQPSAASPRPLRTHPPSPTAVPNRFTTIPPPQPTGGGRLWWYAILASVGLLLVIAVMQSIGRYRSMAGGNAARTVSRNANLIVPPRVADRNIRARLLNASYPSNCFKVFSDVGFESPIPLRNGHWDNGLTDPVKHAYFGVIDNKIIFANLTGDGRREAVVPTACGVYAFTEAYNEVFVIDTSSPTLTVLARLSPEDWGDNPRGITDIWNTSGVRVANGLLLVSFQLGGSHAQPDWEATSGFKWDGSRFVQVGFEAHGETAGAHPNEVIQEGTDLQLATDQGMQAVIPNQSVSESTNGQGGVDLSSSRPMTQSGGASNPESETGGSALTSSAGDLDSSQQPDLPSTTTTAPPSATSGPQSAGSTQAPSGPQGFTVRQWLALAEGQFKADNFNGALQSCDAALKIDPQSVDALQLKGKIEKTMAILGVPATAQTPSVLPTRTVQQWLALAESQFEHDDFRGALQSCNAALQIEPENKQAVQLKGKVASTMKILGGNQ